ncbi:MAG: YeeE/YedE family protein [Rubrivivax sp.]|nr:YeeE/YedE family protein [Rubrivivax sp.]
MKAGATMSVALTRSAVAEPLGGPLVRRARPLWNPYAAGALLGIVLLATYIVTGRGLGATAAFSAVATWLVGLVSADGVQASAVHARYWNDGAPLANWTLFLLAGTALGAFLSGWQGGRLGLRIERGPRIGGGARLALAFLGGFVVAFGARIAKGCTSGQALTGGALLNVGSLVFMLAVFAAAYGLATFVRKEWL